MNLFQTLVLGLFVVLGVLTLSAGFGGVVRKRIVVFWLSVWAFGACAIVWPHATAVAAHALGIGRGADLLLYLSVLVMFVAFFYVYTRFRRLDRELTLLVRRLAIQSASNTPGRPSLPPTAASDEPKSNVQA